MKLVVAILLAAMVTPCLAQTAPAPNASTAADPAKEDTKRICKSKIVTGSIMAKRTCRTRAEWDAIDRDNAAAVEARRRGSGGMGRGG